MKLRYPFHLNYIGLLLRNTTENTQRIPTRTKKKMWVKKWISKKIRFHEGWIPFLIYEY